ncbi:hypothetical protein PhaeoP83_01651 [Phaeobacter inhibens]|uniref:Uncharacterized protein n=1 Tax=Phaeobacter inhibens TaxID=221822 RepID=A0ABM6RDQ2_9RHOB|nr:hypothetical protein PhaeoP83_01651 [Phaeobacter inhibens]AUQ94480.1 hypothetical protein PhaeoP66_01698 [Phaeobacter inhibens]AUR19730.1 hypothetical protein PhaeoP80_01651 [Phaeobacter inhibens]
MYLQNAPGPDASTILVFRCPVMFSGEVSQRMFLWIIGNVMKPKSVRLPIGYRSNDRINLTKRQTIMN